MTKPACVFLILLCTCTWAVAEEKPERLADLRGVFQADLNHDGSRVIARLRSGDTGLWDIATGKPIAGDLGVHVASIDYVMSADGSFILFGFAENARVFDADSAVALSPLLDARMQRELIAPAVFSPDGSTVVIFEATDASVWNIRSGERVAKIPLASGPHEEAPAAAVFARDGRDCFIMDPDGNVTRYDTANWKAVGKPMRPPRFETAYEFSLTVRADGKYLATTDDAGENGPKGQLTIWNAATNKSLGPSLVTTNGYRARFLPGAERILVQPARGDATVYELPSMRVAYTIRAHDELDGPAIEISPDGKWILAWGPNKFLDVIDARTGKPAGNTSNSAPISKMLMSPESNECYAIYDNSAFFLQNYHDHYVIKMSLPDLKITASTRVLDYLLRVSLSPDGHRLLLLEGMTDHEQIRVLETAGLTPAPAE